MDFTAPESMCSAWNTRGSKYLFQPARKSPYEAGPWALTDGDAIATLLERAGFTGVEAAVREVPMVLAGVADAVDVLLASPVADDVRGWGDDPLDRFTTAFATRVRPFVLDGAIDAPSVSNIVVGVVR